MVGVSASFNLPLHHKVQKFSSGTGSPGWSRKKGCKTVVVWCGGGCLLRLFSYLSIRSLSTRIGPLHFQAGGRGKRPNLSLVFLC